VIVSQMSVIFQMVTALLFKTFEPQKKMQYQAVTLTPEGKSVEKILNTFIHHYHQNAVAPPKHVLFLCTGTGVAGYFIPTSPRHASVLAGAEEALRKSCRTTAVARVAHDDFFDRLDYCAVLQLRLGRDYSRFGPLRRIDEHVFPARDLERDSCVDDHPVGPLSDDDDEEEMKERPQGPFDGLNVQIPSSLDSPHTPSVMRESSMPLSPYSRRFEGIEDLPPTQLNFSFDEYLKYN